MNGSDNIGLREAILRRSGAHWGFWFALGVTLGIAFGVVLQ